MLARKIDFGLPVNDRESPVINPGSATDPVGSFILFRVRGRGSYVTITHVVNLTTQLAPNSGPSP